MPCGRHFGTAYCAWVVAARHDRWVAAHAGGTAQEAGLRRQAGWLAAGAPLARQLCTRPLLRARTTLDLPIRQSCWAHTRDKCSWRRRWQGQLTKGQMLQAGAAPPTCTKMPAPIASARPEMGLLNSAHSARLHLLSGRGWRFVKFCPQLQTPSAQRERLEICLTLPTVPGSTCSAGGVGGRVLVGWWVGGGVWRDWWFLGVLGEGGVSVWEGGCMNGGSGGVPQVGEQRLSALHAAVRRSSCSRTKRKQSICCCFKHPLPTHPPILSPNVQVMQVHAHGAVRGPHSSRAAPKPAQQEEAWEEVGKKLGPARASRTSALGAAPGGAHVPSNNAEDGGQAFSRGQRV